MLEDSLLEKIIKAKGLEDYEFILSSDRYPTFKRKLDDRILTIGSGDLTTMKVNSIGCHIIFTSIESYLQDIDGNWYLDWKPTIRQNTHTDLVGHQFGIGIYNNMPIAVDSEDDISNWVKMVERFIKQDADPFFQYWHSIRVFLPLLELNYDDVLGMNKVLTYDSYLKKCIIWYHTSHPEYEKFSRYYETRLKTKLKGKPKNTTLQKGLERFQRIRSKLEQDRPIFEWDPKFLL